MYFKIFPKTFYAFNFQADSPTVVTNIFSRFKMKSEVINNALAMYKYIVQEGDTPELVAYSEYGDASLHWVICLVNNLSDPQFDFPLNQISLEKNILKKYGYNNISLAYSNIHHYELEVENTLIEVNGPTTVNTQTSIVTLNQYDYKTNTITTQTVNVPTTETTVFRANNADINSPVVANLTIKKTYKPVYVYDYEANLNDAKREIKILKKQYIPSLLNELERVLND